MSNKVIVITGSTRGIGLGLADAFLSKGCSVAVSGRNQETVEKSAANLRLKHANAQVFGVPCDVRQPEEIQSLWNKAA
jgi:NAD(P)-dependent dehydrogenase (short-subunit alcohol dehydrogenase family)